MVFALQKSRASGSSSTLCQMYRYSSHTIRPQLGRLCSILFTLVSACRPIAQDPQPTAQAISPDRILALKGAIGAHDPAIIHADGTYYLFATGPGIPISCSPDLITWSACGRVFNQLPVSAYKSVPKVQELWAPDIAFFNGKYHLYYSASTFGSNHSAIALATNTTLNALDKNYKWVDEGVIVESRVNNAYNAIDPNFIRDQDGKAWLAFGSFWTGIKLLALDPQTGKALGDGQLIALAQRPSTAIEAPFITFHDGYYYLFVSFDQCCSGVNSTYHIRVGRSNTITGPYSDRDGKAMRDGGGTLLLQGKTSWRGPGHNALLVDGKRTWLVYHAYDVKSNGAPLLHIEALDWDATGWPQAPSEQLR
jgi:arabinan endo-1,5-alpha-L-arabinosidase